MTYEELIALLTPVDGTLTLPGAALGTPSVTRLFDTYFTNGTMIVTGCTSVPAANETVDVSGTLAPGTFLNLTNATLPAATPGTFRLLEDGSVAVVLDVPVNDSAWTMAQSFPELQRSVFDNLTYAAPTFTLDSHGAEPFPAGYRESFGYPPDDLNVAQNLIHGLEFRSDIGFKGSLTFLEAMLVPPIPLSGPVATFLQFDVEEQKQLVMPQLLLQTDEQGRTRTIGDYEFTFGVQIASLFQEFPGNAGTTVAVIPTGVIAIRTNFVAGSFPAIPVSLYVYQSNRGRLVFNVGGAVNIPITEAGLPALLNGTDVPTEYLHPEGFPAFSVMDLIGVSLAMRTEPMALDAISLAASILPGDTWEVLGGLLSIRDITFLIGAARSGTTWTSTVSLEASAFLLGNPAVALNAGVSLSLQTLSFEASLVYDPSNPLRTLDLTEMVHQLIGTAIDLDEITGATFSISGDIAANEYRFESQITQEWPIFGGIEKGLVLREVGLTLGTDSNRAYGGVYGVLTLAGAKVRLSATYDESGGWTFGGSTEPGQNLDLVALFADLAQVFGVTLPPGLPSILLDQLRVSFATSSGVFSLAASLMIPEATYNLANLPLIGEWLDPSDRISLEKISLTIKTGGTDPSVVDFGFLVGFGRNNTVQVVIPLAGNSSKPGSPPPTAPPPERPITYPTEGSGAFVPAQRFFGPLALEKLGFILDEDGIGVKFNASLSVSGVLLEAIGLGMLVPVTAPFIPKFRLDGLTATYATEAMTFAGGMIRVPVPDDEYMQFDGAVVIKVKKFGISAFASYATSDPPSMFIFAMLNVPIGGPPAFFVTGFSGGFGFNRELILPKIYQVPGYPLVAGASVSSNPFGANPTLSDFLGVMNVYMPRATGQYWAAAGIDVRTYGTLESKLLLTVAFGTRFQVGIIGLSTLSIPPAIAKPVARAQLAMEAAFLPDEGLLSVSAQLTPASYVFEPECTLSGGFAFYLWFSPSDFEGDFVVTLGGYSPYYTPPAHYPAVPRLGMNWSMAGFPLVIKGGAYLALTPHAVMAGGYLNGTWSIPAITAWFSINADFLIQWKPFHYEIRAGVTFGVRATINLGIARVTLNVTLGANLAIWGPPFSGTATLNLGVITLTIAFGAGADVVPPPIGWTEFKESFLPPVISPAPQSKQLTASAGATPTDSILKTLFAEGLQKDLRELGAVVDYTVDPQRLELYVQSVIPAKSVEINGLTLGARNQEFGINPMSVPVEKLSSAMTIELTRSGAQYDFIDVAVMAEPAPKALWLHDAAPQKTINAEPLIENVAQGLTIVPAPDNPAHSLPIDIETLLYTPDGTEPLTWGADDSPTSNPYASDPPVPTMTQTINDPAIATNRMNIVSNLMYSGFLLSPNTNVAPLTDPDTLGLFDPPVLSPLGFNDGETDAAA